MLEERQQRWQTQLSFHKLILLLFSSSTANKWVFFPSDTTSLEPNKQAESNMVVCLPAVMFNYDVTENPASGFRVQQLNLSAITACFYRTNFKEIPSKCKCDRSAQIQQLYCLQQLRFQPSSRVSYKSSHTVSTFDMKLVTHIVGLFLKFWFG